MNNELMNKKPCFAIYNTLSLVLSLVSFLKNKANFRNEQMNISSFMTGKYGQMDIWWIGKNKPNSKPISKQKTDDRWQGR
jgi:hypothetical protein